MLWNQVEKEKKIREKESWRKKERERFWNQVESREKKERMEIYGYTHVVEKNQDKKKKKKKRKKRGNIWMIERKKGKIIYRKRNENLEMLPQYFHNKS